MTTTIKNLPQAIKRYYLYKDRERLVGIYGEDKVKWAEELLAEEDPRDYQDKHYP